MKLNTKFLTSVLLLLSTIDARNVFKGLKYNDLSLREREALEKRSARNVVHLDLKIDDSELFDKRDAKRVQPINLQIHEEDLFGKKKIKRSGKNLINLDFEIDESQLEKRDGRNVAKLNLQLADDEILFKRDAKRLSNVNLIIDDAALFDKKVKRDGKSIYNFNFNLDEELLSTLKESDSPLVLSPASHKEQKVLHSDEKFVLPEEIKDSDLKYTLMPDAKSGSLATALTQTEDVSIFSSYLRDIVDLYNKCESSDDYKISSSANNKDTKMLLIFAPTNLGISELSEKPWEFPTPVTEENNKSDETADANIRNFIESHIVEISSLTDFGSVDSPAAKFKSLNGNTIYLKNSADDGFMLSLADVDDWQSIQKIDIMDNGALLVIDKTLSWPGRASA